MSAKSLPHLFRFEVRDDPTTGASLAYVFVCVMCSSTAEARNRALQTVNANEHQQTKLVEENTVAGVDELTLLPFEQRLIRAARADTSMISVMYRPSYHL